MERSNRIQQLYGYAACLVALVTILITVASVIDAATARRNPLRVSDYFYGVRGDYVLTTYETYEASNPDHRLVRTGRVGAGNAPIYDTLTLAAARARYETLKADREEQVRFNAGRALLRNSVLLLLAIGIFVSHWLWLRRVGADNAAVALRR